MFKTGFDSSRERQGPIETAFWEGLEGKQNLMNFRIDRKQSKIRKIRTGGTVGGAGLVGRSVVNVQMQRSPSHMPPHASIMSLSSKANPFTAHSRANAVCSDEKVRPHPTHETSLGTQAGVNAR